MWCGRTVDQTNSCKASPRKYHKHSVCKFNQIMCTDSHN
uniref:Uncharacterized protein n=1 Tax=Arundo donax TaxID=35708 RepID=A0A0A9H358_ARUDO